MTNDYLVVADGQVSDFDDQINYHLNFSDDSEEEATQRAREDIGMPTGGVVYEVEVPIIATWHGLVVGTGGSAEDAIECAKEWIDANMDSAVNDLSDNICCGIVRDVEVADG